MQLTRLKLEAVRGLNLNLALPSGLFVFTGPPTSGKSTVLEAIAGLKDHVGGSGPAPRASRFFQAGTAGDIAATFKLEEPTRRGLELPTSELELAWNNAAHKPAVSAWLRRYDRSPASFKIEYFHAGRSLLQGDFSGAMRAELRLTRDASKYAWVRAYLVESSREAGAQALGALRESGVLLASEVGRDQAFAKRLSAITQRLHFVGCEQTDAGWDCVFARPGGRRVELAELSTSESMFVLFAAAIEGLGLHRSLLLIDHPEQGLHPEEHARFLEALVASLPDAQLLVTTTSPGILRAVPRERVVVLSGDAGLA